MSSEATSLSSPAESPPADRFPLYFQVLYLVAISALLFPPVSARTHIFLPLVIVSTAQCVAHIVQDSPVRAYLQGACVAQLLMSCLDRLVFSTPEAECFKLDRAESPLDAGPDGADNNDGHLDGGSDKSGRAARDAKKERKAAQTFDSLWDKFRWDVELWMTCRGVGWSWQVKGTPRAVDDGYPVWQFVIEKISRAIIWLVVQDVLQSWVQSRAWPSSTRFQSSGGLGAVLLAHPRLFQVVAGFTCGIRAFLVLDMTYSAAAALTTAVGIWAPRDWPPLFGSVVEAYTVRRFWDVTWHQLIRRTAATPGRYMARDVLRLDKGSVWSMLMVLYVGFTMTGFFHAAGAYCATGHEMGEFAFFLSQAVVISLEKLAAHLMTGVRSPVKGGVKGKGTSVLARGLGHIWVVAWLAFSLRFWGDPEPMSGMWNVDLVPPLGIGRSLVDWILGV